MTHQAVIISGGGTAGHLYPALAVRKKLKDKLPNLRIVFVGTDRSVEKKILGHHQVESIPLNIQGLKGKGWKSILGILLLPAAFIKSLRLILKIKPKLVLGVGGYSSGPIVLLAAWLRIPTLIMEQNLRPGFTNRMLLPWVKKAAASFEASLPYFRGKGIYTGNPVRDEFYALKPKLRSERLVLLVFGGSQGSHILNRTIIAGLPLLAPEKDKLRIFHQTGQRDLEWVRDEYLKNGFTPTDSRIEPFFFDMPKIFEGADLIVCRAGASTIAELIASRKASILVPFARAADNHQEENARELERKQASIVITENKLTPHLMARTILGFVEDKDNINVLEKNLAAFKIPNAAEKIASLCMDLMGIIAQEG